MLRGMHRGTFFGFSCSSVFVVTDTTLFLLFLRTGLVMSTGTSRLVSRGATTFFYPPTTYINKVLESQQFPKYDLSLPRDCKFVSLFDELPPDDLDGIQVHKVIRVVLDVNIRDICFTCSTIYDTALHDFFK
jgi:hypothetical protein